MTTPPHRWPNLDPTCLGQVPTWHHNTIREGGGPNGAQLFFGVRYIFLLEKFFPSWKKNNHKFMISHDVLIICCRKCWFFFGEFCGWPCFQASHQVMYIWKRLAVWLLSVLQLFQTSKNYGTEAISKWLQVYWTIKVLHETWSLLWIPPFYPPRQALLKQWTRSTYSLRYFPWKSAPSEAINLIFAFTWSFMNTL